MLRPGPDLGAMGAYLKAHVSTEKDTTEEAPAPWLTLRVDDWGKPMTGKNRIMERRMPPTTDAERYAVLQQHYHDLVAGVRMIRAAAEKVLGLQLPFRMTVNEGCEAIARAIYEAADRPRPSPVTDHKTRIYFQHRIDAWSDDGENIVEHLAGVEDFEAAQATYRAACERWPNAVITLRQGAGVVEDRR